MIPSGHLLAFALTAFALIVVPGPSVLFVVSRSLTLGRSAGLATVAGNAAGELVQVGTIAIGIGAVVSESIAVFTVLKLIGAAYLIFLGIQAIRHRRRLADALGAPVQTSTRRILRDAFVVGFANPKSIIFFAAILPQFVDRSSGHVPAQLLVLGAIFFMIALVSDGTWAIVAGTARNWLLGSPRRLAAVGGAGGIAMIGIGARLAVTGRQD